jgi:hypothetical protein
VSVIPVSRVCSKHTGCVRESQRERVQYERERERERETRERAAQLKGRV